MKGGGFTAEDLMEAQHSIIQEDFKAQLKTQIGIKADTLKDINAKKVVVQAELERIKLEIKEINLKHKDKILEASSFEESSINYSDREVGSGAEEINNTTLYLNRTLSNNNPKPASTTLDPAGTRLAFKLSEIVMRSNRRGSPKKTPTYTPY